MSQPIQTLKRIFSPEVLLWFYPLLLIVPNVALDFTEPTGVCSKITNVVLPWGVYMLLMGLWKNIGRTASLVLFPVLFYGAFQIVLLFLYGRSIIAIDMFLNVMTTNPTEASELLGNLKGAMATICVLYLPSLVWAIILACRRKFPSPASRDKARIGGLAAIAVGLVCLVLSYLFSDNFRVTREIFPVNVISNTVTALERTDETEKFYETSAAFSYQASSTRPKDEKEIYVLVIGETSRADNWQIFGYDRPTNPRLAKRQNLITFSKALSESNTTHKSVPLMMTWLTADNFGDSIYEIKSIVDAFNEAGFNTAFLSNQGRNHSFIDFFAGEAQKTVFLKDKEKESYDAELIPYLKDFISRSSNDKIFVVLHTYGSHFNYRDRYPSQFEIFKPCTNTDADPNNRKDLINSYDNSILMTDAFLDDVIHVLEADSSSASLIYLADHGEDIYDDSRKRFLHASPVPTYYQIHVPLLIWMSQTFKDRHPRLFATANAHRQCDVSSSRVVFDTMLQLAGISTPYASPRKALTDHRYENVGRRYLNDYNEGVRLDQSGLSEPDFEQLKAHGISAE